MKRFAAVAISLLLILSGCGLKGSEASDGVSGEISDGVSEEESAEISFPPIPVPEHPRILIITPIWLNETEYVEPDYNVSLETAYDYDADLMGPSKRSSSKASASRENIRIPWPLAAPFPVDIWDIPAPLRLSTLHMTTKNKDYEFFM